MTQGTGMGKRILFGIMTVLVLCTATGCFRVFKYGADSTLGYRSPIGVMLERTRQGTPVTEAQAARLKPGESDLGDTMAELGAPCRIRRTPDEEILEYHYLYSRRSRFLLRPFFFLPYGSAPTYNYYADDQGPAIAAFVFNHAGLLKRKELRWSTPDDSPGGNAESIFLP